MSIEITIRQRRLFKKKLPLEVLTGDMLGYGTFDGLRIQEAELPQDRADELILYHPKYIGRGFSANWHKGMRDELCIRLPAPSSTEEIDAFYDTVSRVCEHWDAQWFEQDGESVSVLKIGEWRVEMADFHLRVLNDLCAEEGNTMLPCTFFPLVLGDQEKAMLAGRKSLSAFRDYLHEKQSMNVYYPIPGFYHEDGVLCGVYFIPSETECVLPVKPSVPFLSDVTDEDVARWYVTFYPVGGDEPTGRIRYEDFAREVHFEQLDYFDAEHHLLSGMSVEMQRDILDRAAVG